MCWIATRKYESELGMLKGYKANVLVDLDAQPCLCKPISVPYAMTGKVEEELERLEREGIVKPVQFTAWAAPIVAVLKEDGKYLYLYLW